MTEKFAFPAAPRPTVEIAGGALRFPVRRIFCVGRNYAEHAREMGGGGERAPPFFFTKPADAVMLNGSEIPYPSRTANLHHEIELVVALGGGGRDVVPAEALALVFGYAVGCDLTRRDLQAAAKDQGKPWDTAKGFDHSAPVTPIAPVAKATIRRGQDLARGQRQTAPAGRHRGHDLEGARDHRRALDLVRTRMPET